MDGRHGLLQLPASGVWLFHNSLPLLSRRANAIVMKTFAKYHDCSHEPLHWTESLHGPGTPFRPRDASNASCLENTMYIPSAVAQRCDAKSWSARVISCVNSWNRLQTNCAAHALGATQYSKSTYNKHERQWGHDSSQQNSQS